MCECAFVCGRNDVTRTSGAERTFRRGKSGKTRGVVETGVGCSTTLRDPEWSPPALLSARSAPEGFSWLVRENTPQAAAAAVAASPDRDDVVNTAPVTTIRRRGRKVVFNYAARARA